MTTLQKLADLFYSLDSHAGVHSFIPASKYEQILRCDRTKALYTSLGVQSMAVQTNNMKCLGIQDKSMLTYISLSCRLECRHESLNVFTAQLNITYTPYTYSQTRRTCQNRFV
eukprot:TRINITY_DN128_c1_g1_i1.p1 TRINITY_DN128_c1_g1~~TRINITY_DN128_c1_g1_i1.p1  ORF type:complete len:113 (-),score=0.39 TRINITY_DN128_c1_g1_i1:108-446(-)